MPTPTKYGKDLRKLLPIDTKLPYGTGLWRHILKHKDIIANSSEIKIKSRTDILFWYDKWIGDTPLKVKFPQLFKLSRHKLASIDEVITEGNGLDFKFSRTVNNEERRSLIQLVQLLDQAPPLSTSQDKISCKFVKGNYFSAKECYLNLTAGESVLWEDKLIWRKEIPSKVSFMVWCAARNAIPMSDNLIRRGMVLVNCCYLCNKGEETVHHLLLHCPVTALVWSYFIKSIGLQWVQGNDILSIIKTWQSCALFGRAKQIWILIPFAIWWAVWLGRNDCTFNSKET
ncbi:Reverse transcriptase zinc-binding domain [Macleaya cordata]|uniref:Reverse transcriptase zinc-binding domain n=1 Tax=Macleaya cordata TaxID=56857 RepID=A0A200PSX4_MACCD|nr:Reverse transcriptase zinc-binding domain [Macleaya cordata]